MSTPIEAAALLATEARAALGRLRTAWAWLAEARIPGPEKPAADVPDRRQHVLQARTLQHAADRAAKFEAMRAGRKPSGTKPTPARVGVTDVRKQVADQVAKLAARLWEYAYPHRKIVWPVLDYRTVKLPDRCPTCRGTGWRAPPPWWKRAEPPACGTCDGTGDVERTHAIDPTDALVALSFTLITELLPLIRHPEAAADALRVLDRADRQARKVVNAGEHRIHVQGACPACGSRDLWAETSSPVREEWTVRCETPDCFCAGHGCKCGRPVLWHGRRHLWPAEEWPDLALLLKLPQIVDGV